MKIISSYEEYKTGIQEPHRWIADDTRDADIDWTIISTAQTPNLNKIKKPWLARYVNAFRVVMHGRKADLIVTHGTMLATWVGIFKRLLGVKTLHLAWAFTVPRYEEHSTLRNKIIKFGIRDIDRFVMFSVIETRNYPHYFKLPADRFRMIPWNANRPPVDSTAPPLVSGDYIAAIGGEGRDYATLIEAVRKLPDIKLAIVAMPANLEGLDIPENVQVFTNIPFGDAMNIASNSQFMVLPLLSNTIPCGHGSLISQFLLEKATIVTDSEAMEGYCHNKENALTYPAQDSAALRDAIMELHADSQLRQDIVRSAKEFAETKCSGKHTVQYFYGYLREKGLMPVTA